MHASSIQAGKTYRFEADDLGGHTQVVVHEVEVDGEDITVYGVWSGGDNLASEGGGCFSPDDVVHEVADEEPELQRLSKLQDAHDLAERAAEAAVRFSSADQAAPGTTKLTNLTGLNRQALWELTCADLVDAPEGFARLTIERFNRDNDVVLIPCPAWVGDLKVSSTTATFPVAPETAARWLNEVIAKLPGRGHPKASLHAVLRKVTKQVVPDAELAARLRCD